MCSPRHDIYLHRLWYECNHIVKLNMCFAWFLSTVQHFGCENWWIVLLYVDLCCYIVLNMRIFIVFDTLKKFLFFFFRNSEKFSLNFEFLWNLSDFLPTYSYHTIFFSHCSNEMAVISKRYTRKSPSWSIFCFGPTRMSAQWNHWRRSCGFTSKKQSQLKMAQRQRKAKWFNAKSHMCPVYTRFLMKSW